MATAFFADHISTCSVAEFSVFYLLCRIHPILPCDLTEASFIIDEFTFGMSSSDFLTLKIQQLKRHPADILQAAQMMAIAHFQSKTQFEKKFHKKLHRSIYQFVDLVLVRNTAIEKKLNRKIKPKYLGLYEIDRHTKRELHVLKEMDGTILCQGVAAF